MVFMFLQLNVEFVKNVSIIVAFSLKFTMERVKSGFRKSVLFLEKESNFLSRLGLDRLVFVFFCLTFVVGRKEP